MYISEGIFIREYWKTYEQTETEATQPTLRNDSLMKHLVNVNKEYSLLNISKIPVRNLKKNRSNKQAQGGRVLGPYAKAECI